MRPVLDSPKGAFNRGFFTVSVCSGRRGNHDWRLKRTLLQDQENGTKIMSSYRYQTSKSFFYFKILSPTL